MKNRGSEPVRIATSVMASPTINDDILEVIAEHRTPRAKLLALFDYHAENLSHPAYRRCAFTRAQQESFDSKSVRNVCQDSRAWLRALFRDLAHEAGITIADTLVAQLMVLYDGSSVSAYMDSSGEAARIARDIAAKLWDHSAP